MLFDLQLKAKRNTKNKPPRRLLFLIFLNYVSVKTWSIILALVLGLTLGLGLIMIQTMTLTVVLVFFLFLFLIVIFETCNTIGTNRAKIIRFYNLRGLIGNIYQVLNFCSFLIKFLNFFHSFNRNGNQIGCFL